MITTLYRIRGVLWVVAFICTVLSLIGFPSIITAIMWILFIASIVVGER